MSTYKPEYGNSWALVIGINRYKDAPQLSYAVNDAQAVADVLIQQFDFPNENVTVLRDSKATATAIRRALLRHTADDVHDDDRFLVFFAGHGHTMTGHRGEIGFLVPVDGSTGDLSTLIRWDEFTRHSELIRAKHVFFVMDTCYGGLALIRAAPGGSMRFLKNMLQRYSRQVLTAGKADEVVSDAGGPRPGHSVFTGHFLDALEGAAATDEGVLTANNVMSYVYNRVSKDYESQQTPHFGFLDGDGDFIFDVGTALEGLNDQETISTDVLVSVSQSEDPMQVPVQERELLKEYLADDRYRIKLDDVVTIEVRRVLGVLNSDSFPLDTSGLEVEDFAARLTKYEEACARLLDQVVLLARWGEEEHRGTLERVIARLTDFERLGSGKVVWLGLRWYPILLAAYAGGVAALANADYDNLATLLLTRVGARRSHEEAQPVAVAMVDGILEVERTDIFKSLPGHERKYVPKSEYLFRLLQPTLEDILFLGSSYEVLFDRFEVLLALTHADLDYREESESVWGPPGRFGWKMARGTGTDPFTAVVAEATQEREAWAPLQAGFFRGDIERFEMIATKYRKMLGRLRWL